jgi:precorrin-2 dehydrogenase/sirohydrochlorin ferrochelatase
MSYFPAFLNVEHCRLTVIGGGPIAERKVEDLLNAGARHVTVVSPELTPALAAHAAAGTIAVRQRRFEDGDCAGSTIVIAATSDPEVQQQIWNDAHSAGALVNTVDRPEMCDFIVPAVTRSGSITIAVSTGGKSPALASLLRDRIAEIIGPEYGALAELLGKHRPAVRRRIPDFQSRKDAIRAVARSEVLKDLQSGNTFAAERRIDRILRRFERKGEP